MPPRVATRRIGFVCQICREKVARTGVQKRFTSSNPEIYDVVIVGGGPVGLALLAALKSSPSTSHLRTALLETQDLGKQRQWRLPPDRFSNRASSLTPSSIEFLESSGVWQHVDQSRTQPYQEMEVWDAGNDSSIRFDGRTEAQRYNAPLPTVATMTENANLSKGLLDRISELGVEDSLFPHTKVESIAAGTDDPEGMDLSTWPVATISSTVSPALESSRQMAARLLIGADGFNSPVRNYANIPASGWDYHRHGVVATLQLATPEEQSSSHQSENIFTAYQRFLPSSSLGGPIAILPLPNNHASLVWSTTPEVSAHLKTLPSASIIQILNAALRLKQVDIKYLLSLPSSTDPTIYESELRWRLQNTSPPAISRPPPTIIGIQENTLASFPLRFRHCTALTHPRIALVGDAAHTIHPLAGQGLNLGLADARSLAECITYSVEHGMDLGKLMSLERYASARFGKGLLMAGAVDLLNTAYQFGGGGDGLVSTTVGRIRGLGVKGVETLGLKGLFMRVADGL